MCAHTVGYVVAEPVYAGRPDRVREVFRVYVRPCEASSPASSVQTADMSDGGAESSHYVGVYDASVSQIMQYRVEA